MQHNDKSRDIEDAVDLLDSKLDEVEESFESLSTYDQQAQAEYETLAALQASPKIFLFVFAIVTIILGFLFVEKRNEDGVTLDFLQLTTLNRHSNVLNCYKDIRALAIQIAGGHQSELGRKISQADDIDVLEDVIRIEEIKIKKKLSKDTPFDFTEEDPGPSFEFKGNSPSDTVIPKKVQPAKELEPIAPPDPLPNQEEEALD